METSTFQLEPEEKSVFDTLYLLCEKHSLDHSNQFELGNLYDLLQRLDLEYRVYNENATNFSTSLMYEFVERSLGAFCLSFDLVGFSDRPLFWSFKKYLVWFNFLLKDSRNIVNPTYFSKNLLINFPSLAGDSFKRLNDLNIQSMDNYEKGSLGRAPYYLNKFENELAEDFGVSTEDGNFMRSTYYIYGDGYLVTHLDWNWKVENLEKVGSHYEIMLELNMSDSVNNNLLLLNNLNLILQGFSFISNCEVKIEKISVASLHAKVTLILKDLLARKEVKEVLRAVREKLVKVATGESITELNYFKTETEKLNAEKDKIEKDLENLPSIDEVRLERALKMESQALENELKRVRIGKERLDGIERVSDLMVKGVIESDTIGININEILYLFKDKDNLSAPDNIDDIS